MYASLRNIWIKGIANLNFHIRKENFCPGILLTIYSRAWTDCLFRSRYSELGATNWVTSDLWGLLQSSVLPRRGRDWSWGLVLGQNLQLAPIIAHAVSRSGIWRMLRSVAGMEQYPTSAAPRNHLNSSARCTLLGRRTIGSPADLTNQPRTITLDIPGSVTSSTTSCIISRWRVLSKTM